MIRATTAASTRGLMLAIVLAVLATPAVAASRGKAPKVGDHIKDCRNCPELVVLPAGKFLMGSPLDEAERRDNEKQRQITFARPFAMSATPVPS